MNRSLDSVKKNIAGMRAEAEGLALGLAIRQAAEFVKRNLDLAGSLGETAQQLGVTTRELQVYRAIGGQVGVTTEEMDTGLQKLTSSIGKASVGAKAQNSAFEALGVSIRDSSGHVKSTGTVLEEMADKLAKVPDPAQRAAVEVAVFGRAGQKLDTILTGGKAGIEQYAKTAEDMGMVLSDDLVTAADNASDKIEQLNAQLTANIQSAVAQNANAILGLASALSTLTTRAIQFINQHPALTAALAGAAVGARVAGAPGAALGAVAGAVVEDRMARNAADQNMSLVYRNEQLRKATARANDVIRTAGAPRTTLQRLGITPDYGVHRDDKAYNAAKAELNKQISLHRRAMNAAPAATGVVVPPVDIPDFMAGGGGGGGRKGRGPKAAKLDDSAERFAVEMSRIGEDILRIKRDNLTDIDAIALIDKELLVKQVATEALAIDKDVKDKRITEAQGEQLKLANAIAAALKGEQINREALADKVKESLDTKIAANDNERDVLEAQESLAVTTDQRRQIQLSILDLDKQTERLKLQETINLARLGKATQAQADAAQKKLDNLDTVYGLRGDSIRQQTRSPLDQYIADSDPAKLHERTQTLIVGELEAVHHGITDAISNTLGVQDPLLKGLIDMFIEQVLIRPIAQALQQAQGAGGGGGGGLFGTLLGIGGSILGGGGGGMDSLGGASSIGASLSGGGDWFAALPAFAAGTNHAPPGMALVGENGPEVVRFRGGEQVIPNHMLRGGNDNGGNTYHINVGSGGTERDRRDTAAQVQRVIRQENARNLRMGG